MPLDCARQSARRPQMATPSAAHGRGKDRSLASTGAADRGWQGRFIPSSSALAAAGARDADPHAPWAEAAFCSSSLLQIFFHPPFLSVFPSSQPTRHPERVVRDYLFVVVAVSCLPSLFAPPQQLASRSGLVRLPVGYVSVLKQACRANENAEVSPPPP